jgi:gluconolactonase
MTPFASNPIFVLQSFQGVLVIQNCFNDLAALDWELGQILSTFYFYIVAVVQRDRWSPQEPTPVGVLVALRFPGSSDAAMTVAPAKLDLKANSLYMFKCRTNKYNPKVSLKLFRMTPQISPHKFEIFADGLDHPEGLAFDADGNLWAGGELGQIYKINRSGKVRTIATLGGFNLGLTFSPRQELFVCNFKLGALIQLDRSGKTIRSWERAGRYRLRTPNFSVFDRHGNLYFSDSGEFKREDGFLFVLRPNGKIEQLLDRLSFPNGLSLSADERTLYIVQSTKNNVLALPIMDTGTIGKPRVYAAGFNNVPDGATLDAEGNLYVTCYASHNVYRVTPKGKVSLFASDPEGTMLASPTNAAFGGADFDEMYFANLSRWHICRARVGIRGQLLASHR